MTRLRRLCDTPGRRPAVAIVTGRACGDDRSPCVPDRHRRARPRLPRRFCQEDRRREDRYRPCPLDDGMAAGLDLALGERIAGIADGRQRTLPKRASIFGHGWSFRHCASTARNSFRNDVFGFFASAASASRSAASADDSQRWRRGFQVGGVNSATPMQARHRRRAVHLEPGQHVVAQWRETSPLESKICIVILLNIERQHVPLRIPNVIKMF